MKQKHLQLLILGVLSFMMLIMGIGFAAYSQNLNITGTTTVAKNKWSVHFVGEPVTYPEQGLRVPTFTMSPDSLTLDFKLKLDKPGDEAGFVINYINDGTFDAKLIGAELSGVSDDQKKFIAYAATECENIGTLEKPSASECQALAGHNFGGASLDSNPNLQPVIVPANQERSNRVIVFSVRYAAPELPEDLPQTEQTVDMTLTLHFEQA